MPELQEEYRNKVVVAFQEMRDAETRYYEVVHDYLCFKLTEEEIITYIGNSLLFASMAVYAYEHDQYQICKSGYSLGEISIGFDELEKIINNFADLHNMNDEPKFMYFKKILENFYEDCDTYVITNLNGDGIKVGGRWIDFADYNVEYHDEWSYSETFNFHDRYKDFFGRVKHVFEKHFPFIIENVMSGKHTGIADLLAEDCQVGEIYKKIGLKNQSRWEFNKLAENRKRLIEEYVSAFIVDQCKSKAV